MHIREERKKAMEKKRRKMKDALNGHYEASIKILAEVTRKIEELRNDESANWGHVGSMEHARQLLNELNVSLTPNVECERDHYI